MALAERILQGDIRAAARLMRDIDDRRGGAVEELKILYPHTGRAYVIGITGPPGAGKSTLVDQMTAQYRNRGNKVGIVAVDPTSPFTGGAILGDRIRMNRHGDDEGVFIRSLATRGHLGGLSRSTADVVNVMDAMGMDVVIVETVGVGQDEVEIVRLAHSTIVVTIPGMGDDIQAIKAGILEIGDLFLVNKADREGADRTARELTVMLEMKQYGSDDWQPRVLLVEALRNRGIGEFVTALEEHRAYLHASGKIEQIFRERNIQLLLDFLKEQLFTAVYEPLHVNGRFREIVEGIMARQTDPYSAAEQIIAANLKH